MTVASPSGSVILVSKTPPTTLAGVPLTSTSSVFSAVPLIVTRVVFTILPGSGDVIAITGSGSLI